MTDLVQETLLAIFPDLKVALLLEDHEQTSGTSGWEEASNLRLKGDLRPIIIYGFQKLGRERNKGEMCDDNGFYYLRLPTDIGEIRSAIIRISHSMPPDGWMSDKTLRNYVIDRVRSFKHTCDNVWSAMSSSAYRAERAVKENPGSIPAPLSELKPDFVEKLLEEYRDLEPVAIRLGIEGADRVSRILEEALETVGRIQGDPASASAGVALAFVAVEKIQSAAEILGRVKEFRHDG
ncbi:MAG: hypothetical protein FJ123_00900 [Deltaproteobacteria bacterium]|nr:hypothetical protein [Deltaproteobacteria bacterium]